MKFRKRPVVVEATQWFPGVEIPGVTENWYHAWDGKAISAGTATCVTIHGQATVIVPGDWIITEPDGVHHYPCKPDIFAATYEEVR